MIVESFIAEHKQSLTLRLKKIEAYEILFDSFDKDYDADDTLSTGYFGKLNKPEITMIDPSS